MTDSPAIAQAMAAALASLPPPLRDRVAQHWEEYQAAAAQPGLDASLAAELCRVWAVSDFAASRCVRHPELFAELLHSGDLHRAYASGELVAKLQAAVAPAADAQALGRQLRLCRQREMLRIAWRDITGQADLNATLADLSALADACIQGAVARLQGQLIQELGIPQDSNGRHQRLLVIGMGKLGAGELNFSSDVDLVFAYPAAGQTTLGHDNEAFFTRLGKQLIRALDETTAEGFVFRVDMRLRPFGQSGALVHSFEAIEDYYQAHGREWERYALIKARQVAGDAADGEALFAVLRPFVFRRYLDFGAFEALRDMKKMIEVEVARKGMEDNIKLGPGGIREVEFIGQAFQLVRGGREPALQRREIQTVLRYLAEHHYLPGYAVAELLQAYTFLRNTEHRLQQYQDQQTHTLPADALGRLRLAYAMGFDSWELFEALLRRQMATVHRHFEQVFSAPQTAPAPDDTNSLGALWLAQPVTAEAVAILRRGGYQQAESTWERLSEFRLGHVLRTLSTTGRLRLDRVLPLLLGAAVEIAPPTITPDQVLQRLLTLVEAIAHRSAYLSLLTEYPTALSQLVRLVAASPWITNLLTRHPLLLDEFLHAETLYTPPRREQLVQTLEQRLAAVPVEDLEQAMDVLRQFKQASVFRVAAADIMDAVPLMQVSDRLTDIAEVVVNEVLALAWRDMTRRYGRPRAVMGQDMEQDTVQDTVQDRGFAVIAYGKLGGIELGYGSDLDLVFLHASEDVNAMTDGPKPVADSVFFARLGQRIIHLLTAHTTAGVLYEVDMRLRPSGASGLLVVSLATFREYQQTQAWTWEHQALLRARVIAGDQRLRAAFEEIRVAVLAREREPCQLQQDIVEMRARMRESLEQAGAGEFDLKQGAGGIADIEFMVQYMALRWASRHAALVQYTDVIRILEAIAGQGLLPADDAALLSDAYRAYRAQVHRLTLQELPARVPAAQFATQRQAVGRLWRQLLEAPLPGR